MTDEEVGVFLGQVAKEREDNKLWQLYLLFLRDLGGASGQAEQALEQARRALKVWEGR